MPSHQRKHVFTQSPFEPVLGSCRAVRVGSVIAVSGTAPLGPDGATVAVGDAAGQARRCLEIAKEALSGLGASLPDVIRTRILLTRIADWVDVARVHGEFFGKTRPACTVVEVSRFVDAAWLVEVEFDAVVAG